MRNGRERVNLGTMRFRLGTFNAFNLVAEGVPYYGRLNYNHTDYQKKVEWCAGQLQKMDADVVGFQEVFHRRALEDVAKRSGLYPQAVIEVAGETGDLPRVGLISRFPVRKIEVIENFPAAARVDVDGQPLPFTQFHRPVLKAWIDLPTGQTMVVFVVHLKSKRPMVPEGAPRHDPWEETKGLVRSLLLRACESAALRYLILEEIQETKTPLVVLGDLNDAAHAVTSDILQGRLPQKNYPLDVKFKLWDILLYACGDLQVRKSYKDVYFTHLHNSHYESLDHIFVSQEFVNENPKCLGNVEYMKLFTDHLFDTALSDEAPPPWTSDHGQVVVSIRLKDPKKDNHEP